MAIRTVTKDCTALSDADLAEMAELPGGSGAPYEIGTLSKQAEAWVLVTLARGEDALRGYSFCTLERIGGTPSVLIGLAAVGRASDCAEVLSSMMQDQLRRAVLAFPDEDVLIGTRLRCPGGFEAFSTLQDIVPRPGHKASGEERAWGRRLAKRFGIDAGSYDDRTFIAAGDGSVPLALDFDVADRRKVDRSVTKLFGDVDVAGGGALIVFGWAMAEDLDALLKATR
ncbi:MAG: hypothetical protein FJW83_08615 [Actinobacteria bacterium]|nr:hypothetical protein [Actinomycetota bacterium]